MSKEAATTTPCDDTSFDSTPGACPAFYRGQDSGIDGACREIERAMNRDDDGAGIVGSDRLEALRRRILDEQVPFDPERAGCKLIGSRSYLHRSEEGAEVSLSLCRSVDGGAWVAEIALAATYTVIRIPTDLPHGIALSILRVNGWEG